MQVSCDQARLQDRTDMASSPTDELYKRMREAITKKKYEEMEDIIGDHRYCPDAVGAKDARTNIHTACQRNDGRAVNILLGQGNIDTNAETSDRLTPLMMASQAGHLEALEALLEDLRVDPERTDDTDRTAKEMFPEGKEIKKAKAMKMFEKRERRVAGAVEGERVAVVIGNIHYKGTGLNNLPGAGRDVTEITAFLKTSNYDVKTVMDSKNIIVDIMNVMKAIPSGSIKYLQFFYAGMAIF